MRRTLAFALLAAVALAASVPVSIVTAGKAAADVHQGRCNCWAAHAARGARRGR